MELTQKELVEDHLTIGIRELKNSKKWYRIIYSKIEQKNHWYSLKLTEDGTNQKGEAKRRARKLYKQFYDKISKGIAPTEKTHIIDIAEDYKEYITSLAERNEELEKEGKIAINEVKHGKGKYTVKKAKAACAMVDVLKEFFNQIPKKHIHTIDFRDLNKFSDWALKHKEWSPSRIARYITQIRFIYWFAYDKGLIDNIPQIKAQPQNIQERARRDLTEDEYGRMVDWAWERKEWLRKHPSAKERLLADKAYQFFIFLMVVSYTGVRPPNGSVEKNLLRWDSLQKTTLLDGTESWTFVRQEKKEKKIIFCGCNARGTSLAKAR